MRVLYIEDEQFLAEAVIHLFKKQKIIVDHVTDGEQGLELGLKGIHDAIVLDLMLPKMSGFEVLEALRSRGVKTPVIILSALNEVEDKVKGLELGADDYLAKPFKTVELIARIRAICRRPPLIEGKELRFGDLRFDVDNRTLNGVALTDKEAGLFEILAKNEGNVVTKAQILAYVWGGEATTEENYVEVYVSYLRRKFKEVGSEVKIKVLRGLGYKLSTE